MKIDVFSNGQLLYSIEGTDSNADIVIVSKNLIEKATMTSDGFESLVKEKCHACKTFQAAYESAEEQHEGLFGHRKYSGYESFRRVKFRKK